MSHGLPTKPTDLGQILDDNNTKLITAADASPGSPWQGTPTRTRSLGIVGVLVTVISSAPLAGSWTFEFGEDGVTWPISITLPASDFSTIKFRQLDNVGEWFRAAFEPDSALGAEVVALTTQLSRQADPPFVVPIGHVFEESEAAFPQTIAFLQLFDANTGLSTNVRPTKQGDIRTSDQRITVNESGSLFTESVRDDIALSFSRDSGAASLATLVNHNSGGTQTHDSTEGRLVCATTSTSGRISYAESPVAATYEPGHAIRGETTIELSALPAGTAKIEWGFGEDDGSNDILNGAGFGYDATGFYVWRKKAGAYATKVYQSAFNRDRLDGAASSRFVDADGPAVFDALKNNLYIVEYEWLGAAPIRFRIMSPSSDYLTCHVDETANSIDGTTFPEPELPMLIRAANGNQATDYQAFSGSWRGGVYSSKEIPTTANHPQADHFAVLATATQVVFKKAGRIGVSLTNDADSARAFTYDFTSGVTVGSAFVVPAGGTLDRPWGPDVEVWAIQAGGSGTVGCSVEDLIP